MDVWEKVLTPSQELRTWFHEDASRRDEFEAKYRMELEDISDEIAKRLIAIDEPVMTLVTAAKDLAFGHVAVPRRFVEERKTAPCDPVSRFDYPVLSESIPTVAFAWEHRHQCDPNNSLLAAFEIATTAGCLSRRSTEMA